MAGGLTIGASGAQAGLGRIPVIQVKNATVRVSVDSTQARASEGYLGWYAGIDDDKSYTDSQVAKGISKTNAEGYRLSRIQLGSPYREIYGTRLSQWMDDHQTQIAYLPKTPPAINVEFTPAEISYPPPAVNLFA